jgi:hypothetical protein
MVLQADPQRWQLLPAQRKNKTLAKAFAKGVAGRPISLTN